MTAIPNFANYLPVKIRFGEGVASTLPAVLGEIGATHVFLMVDEGIERFNPAATALLAQLSADAELTITRFDKPAAEPTIDMVDDATRALSASGAGAVVALGGGSVIDTAKAARLCSQLGMGFREFLASAPGYPAPTVPLIAIPTSAGTGSEVSGGSVVSDPEAGRKNGIANANLRAQYALVDPQLTYSMPPTMTANTGIDALAQAIAGMVAKVRTPIGDGIALEAIRMMSPALVAGYRDGTDTAARAAMSCGSMMAGLTMNISDCTSEHSLGQAIGGVKHVPHGLTIGLVLAETLERERAHVPEILERVADAMGAPDDGSRDGSRCVRAVRAILADLDFPVLSSLGFTESDLDGLADLALADYFITMSPVTWTKAEVVTAFAAALSLTTRAA
ncbi:MAG TPA: iron-containing alcohol dehydrogenase [Acidimicrobiales bacterium]|nr:iron-containing alcohol dehydrogenase [Acidimicrobiales bacterium]